MRSNGSHRGNFSDLYATGQVWFSPTPIIPNGGFRAVASIAYLQTATQTGGSMQVHSWNCNVWSSSPFSPRSVVRSPIGCSGLKLASFAGLYEE
jgi:hypothetical protein